MTYISREIKIIYSDRKSISVKVSQDEKVVVRAPKGISKTKINSFIDKQKDWISRQIVETKKKNIKLQQYKFSENQIKNLKKKARKIIASRLDELSNEMSIKYKKFRLSGARKRWGSCSNKQTISLSWKLIFAPPQVLDYVIIHELSHLKFMNHSRKFWEFLEKYAPDYKNHKKWLKENDFLLRIE